MFFTNVALSPDLSSEMLIITYFYLYNYRNDGQTTKIRTKLYGCKNKGQHLLDVS